METANSRSAAVDLRSPEYARLHEFNYLPSLYVHPAHAASLLPAAWSARLNDGPVPPAVHSHLSAYLLAKLGIEDAWVSDDRSLAIWIALLPREHLDPLMRRAGLLLASAPIHQCVRQQDVKRLEAGLSPQDLAYVFQQTESRFPGSRALTAALYESPLETVMALGLRALQQVTGGLGRAVRIRFDLKLNPTHTLPEWLEFEAAWPHDVVASAFMRLKDEQESTWALSNSKTSMPRT